MKFKGDIIITDPCYLDSANFDLETSNWWEESHCGDYLDPDIFTTYISEYTIIGDWNWCVVNEDTGKDIGAFCADAGRVCVCLLDEVRKFNPFFEEWLETHKWCGTIIKDFDGEIDYVVDTDDNFHIVGKGNINFKTY